MLGIVFKVKVKGEKRQAFLDFIEWDIRVARECEPRTLRFDLYQDLRTRTLSSFTKRTRTGGLRRTSGEPTV
jgi:hypothetical protein